MVKGVHKKIIEVNHPDSLYFDRAVFYLRPGITQLPPHLSGEDAETLLQELSPRKRRPGWKWTLLLVVCSCVVTAAVCLLVR